MFFVDLPEKEDVEDEDEDEIDKSIKEIHQSAQKLSDSIVHVAGNNKTLADNDDKLNAISATFKGKFTLLCLELHTYSGRTLKWCITFVPIIRTSKPFWLLQGI